MTFGPALRATAGIAVLSGMDAVIKGMAAHYPVLQVAFLRFVFGTLVAAGVVAVLRPGWPSRETTIANGLRSVIAVLTATTFFYALSELPLAETLVLSFLAPMFVALFGLVLLREPVGGRVVAALAAGFAGTLVWCSARAGRGRASAPGQASRRRSPRRCCTPSRWSSCGSGRCGTGMRTSSSSRTSARCC